MDHPFTENNHFSIRSLSTIQLSPSTENYNASIDSINENGSNFNAQSVNLVRDSMNLYLRKHKLDLKLLPNKKMIKLSDLTSSGSFGLRQSSENTILGNNESSNQVSSSSNDAILDDSINNLNNGNNTKFIKFIFKY